MQSDKAKSYKYLKIYQLSLENDFIKFLIYSHASSLEAQSQADFLDHVHPGSGWDKITRELDILGLKIHNFIIYVENNWRT